MLVYANRFIVIVIMRCQILISKWNPIFYLLFVALINLSFNIVNVNQLLIYTTYTLWHHSTQTDYLTHSQWQCRIFAPFRSEFDSVCYCYWNSTMGSLVCAFEQKYPIHTSQPGRCVRENNWSISLRNCLTIRVIVWKSTQHVRCVYFSIISAAAV